MLVRETTRKEIEEKFVGMNEYVRIDYLTSCLKSNLDFETRKFVLVKLSGLLENKGMFLDAGKAMKSAAEINTAKQNKINDFMKAAELFIRGGDYDMADATRQKLAQIVEGEQLVLLDRILKETYRVQAKYLIEKHRRKQAIEVYEKMVEIEKMTNEKAELQKKLLELYESVGEMNKFILLKRKIGEK